MLKYLADSVIQIATVMILIGAIMGYVKAAYGTKAGKLMLISVGAGTLGAILMAILKTATDMLDTGAWNLRIYIASFAAFVLFIVFTALKKVLKKLEALLPCIMLGILIFLHMVYSYSDFFVFPNTIMLTEDSVISTVFLTKMAGVVLGFIITLVMAFAAHRSFRKLKRTEGLVLIILALLVTQVKQVAAAFSIMLARRILSSNHVLFTVAKFSNNNSNLFVYLTMAVLFIAVLLLLIRSAHVNEPYSNPAQHRKIIFKWRMIRRWCVTAIVTIAVSVFTMTVIYEIANKPVELSPIEECEIKDDALYIPFEQVEDGHLHRFGYESENGITIRVIVIKKPNSSAYGIGLDACDICGETGYYEKDGEVVCNKCDVVMNINTIGYKGGCNPIVIDYQISNGHIIIPVEGLLEHESEFKG